MEVSDTVEKEGFANVNLQARISERGKRMVKAFVIQRQITCNLNFARFCKRSRKPVLRTTDISVNPLNAELNPIRHLLALVGDRHIVHVSRIRFKAASQPASARVDSRLEQPRRRASERETT